MSEEIDKWLSSWRNDFYKLKRRLRFALMRLEDGLMTNNRSEAERWQNVSNVHAYRFAHCSYRYSEWLIMRGYNRYRPIDRLERECKSYLRRILYLKKSKRLDENDWQRPV